MDRNLPQEYKNQNNEEPGQNSSKREVKKEDQLNGVSAEHPIIAGGDANLSPDAGKRLL